MACWLTVCLENIQRRMLIWYPPVDVKRQCLPSLSPLENVTWHVDVGSASNDKYLSLLSSPTVIYTVVL
jgi:hypothetical protein